MNRKTAIAAAAAVTMTIAAGALALAANLGVLGNTAETVGDAVATPQAVETVFVDQPAPAASLSDDAATPIETVIVEQPASNGRSEASDDEPEREDEDEAEHEAEDD